MPQSVRVQPHKTVDYSSNNTQSIQLRRGSVIRELYLKLSGQPTITTGNNTEANTQRGDEWGVVKRIRIIANGTDVLFDMDGNALWWHNLMYAGNPPLVSPELAKGTQANPIFGPHEALGVGVQGSHLVIPFWMQNARRPIDTQLDTRGMSDLVLEVDWGSHTDVNSAATGWTTEPSLKVSALEAFGVADDAAFSSWRRFKIEQTITASSSNFIIDLPVNRVYRGVILNATDGGADANDIINEVTIKSGGNVFYKWDAETLQDVMMRQFDIRRHFDPATEAYDPMRRGSDNDVTGWYFLDWVTDGMLTEAIDTLTFVDFQIELDVSVGSGTTKVTAYPSSIVPVRG